jgi:hypothetical protein
MGSGPSGTTTAFLAGVLTLNASRSQLAWWQRVQVHNDRHPG